MTVPTVFISYSHKDEAWKNRLRPQLGVLEKAGRLTIWDDRGIDGGATWYPKITDAMEHALVAVCLISPDYLNSDFCIKEEIPFLLKRREGEGMLLLPVLIRPCAWETHDWLKAIQMLPRDGKSISADFKDDWDTPLVEVAREVNSFLDNPVPKMSVLSTPLWSPPEKVDVDRLPVTGAELFGRQDELKLLDETWKSSEINVISFVAWGGVGKSTLVNKWREQMAADNYRGARRVYAWSFYSQGTGERVTSADLFIAEALKWFGDSEMANSNASPWDKGQRLADLVRKEKTLLLLDGMEPLQSYLDFERGKIKDPALAVLVTELAEENPGLCVITTREKVVDLTEFPKTTNEVNLEQISAEAGRALLRVGGVKGTDAELEKAAHDFGLHALALNLLSAYLHEIPGHDISKASEIPDLDVPLHEGKHPRRVMSAFVKRFGESAEVDLLHILGLFNSPANKEEIAALREAPPILNLTEHLQRMSDAKWLGLVNKLRHTKLIVSESSHRPDTLDAHPLVREHFGKQLKQEYPAAWREGNNCLYEYYKAIAKEFPDSHEEMAPLFAGVLHGCQAERHQEALDEVFFRRMDRGGGRAFIVKNLGAMSSALASLSNYFDPPWSSVIKGLRANSMGYVLNNAGFCLRALGRLAEATQLIHVGLEARIAETNWKNAAISASNLSEVYLIIGDVTQALKYARQSIELADRSGDGDHRISCRAKHAYVLHQAGHIGEAEIVFREAEEMQKQIHPQVPFLIFYLAGVLYSDLLLEQGKYLEVQTRASKSLELTQSTLLDDALDNLSLGWAHLLQSQREPDHLFTESLTYLNRAVNGLRQAGTQDMLPRGLLARAEFYSVTGVFDKAKKDLDETFSIATRGGMGLFLADCHLGYARLYLAKSEKEKAHEYWQIAKDSIEKMGYHRRDKEVQELEEQLS